jgi:broad specificity phosphatase PhoE
MKVIFVRHADLACPYDNYDRLSLEQLDLLATGTAQPHINTKLAMAKIQKHIADGFFAKDGINAIYYSPALRAKETAALLAGTLDVTEVEELGCLHEIVFSPSKLISEATFQRKGMDVVREAVYKAVAENKADEATPAMLARVRQIQSLIARNDDKTIIIVTHGFFMRLLQLVFLLKTVHFSVSNQQQVVNYDYLQGFAYTEDQS